jgi:hypothetical protein
MLVVRFALSLFAIALITIGVATSISPIPFGFVLVIIGIIILALADPHARPLLRWIRSHWPWLNRRLHEAQANSPEMVSQPLRETEPGSEAENLDCDQR